MQFFFTFLWLFKATHNGAVRRPTPYRRATDTWAYVCSSRHVICKENILTSAYTVKISVITLCQYHTVIDVCVALITEVQMTAIDGRKL